MYKHAGERQTEQRKERKIGRRDKEVNLSVLGQINGGTINYAFQFTRWVLSVEIVCFSIHTIEISCLYVWANLESLIGTGCMVAAIAMAAQKTPIYIGKPHKPMFELLQKQWVSCTRYEYMPQSQTSTTRFVCLPYECAVYAPWFWIYCQCLSHGVFLLFTSHLLHIE